MAKTRTTLSEISKALNVSISTVSKALSNSDEISVLTKKRVNDFAKSCNYTPNHLATSFRIGCTKIIGLIIPNILNPFYAKVLVGIEKYLDEQGYKLITSISNDSIEKETKNISIMTSGYVDGIIICASKESELKQNHTHFNIISNNGIPLVMFDRICNSIMCDKVIIDDFKAAFDATESLIINKKCKNIVMTAPTKKLLHLNLRQNGFLAAIKKHDTTVKGTIINGNDSKTINQKLLETIKKEKAIDGIFGLNQKAVVKAIRISREIEKNNQRMIAISGFCNNLGENFDSSLIIVDQNAKTIGKESAKLLLNRINNAAGKSDFYTKTIAVNLL